MKVSREKARENREQTLGAAACLLRERGLNGVGVADIMKAAGLTHGGFYRNFASKDELAVKAAERAIAQTIEQLKAGIAGASTDPLRLLVEAYVSPAHSGDPGSGCILPALAADAARSNDPALRTVFTDAIQYYLDQLAALSRDSKAAASSRHPAAILSEMVGAVILARVAEGSPLAQALMSAVVADLLGPGAQDTPA